MITIALLHKQKEPQFHQRSKHVFRRYYVIREVIGRNDIIIEKVPTNHNIVDPLTKPLPQKKYDSHVLAYGMRYKGD